MTSIKLTVTGAEAQASVTGKLTSGMVGIPITIEYNEAWEGLTKNLVCRCGERGDLDGEQRTILNVGEAAVVAHEVMKAGMSLYLGLEGYSPDGKLVIPTTWAECKEKIQIGANTGEELSADPTLPIWDQLQAEIQQLKQGTLTPEQIADIQAAAQEAAVSASRAEAAAKRAEEADSGENGSSQSASLATAQINALQGMFKVCLFDDSKDVDGAIAAFETAFGISDSGGDSGGEDFGGDDSGGTTGDALPTDGLMAYFDLRNLGDKINVTVGTTKGVLATQGEGALYSWATIPIDSSDEYGIKSSRAMMFSSAGGSTQTDLGDEFTVISLGYGECIGPGIKATNIQPRWMFQPSYNNANGTADATAIQASELNADDMTDYNYAVYRVSGANLTIINDTSRKDYNGSDYDGFISWDSMPTVGRTFYGGGYGTAVAIYNRALTDVEIEEARAFMKTLEVTA